MNIYPLIISLCEHMNDSGMMLLSEHDFNVTSCLQIENSKAT